MNPEVKIRISALDSSQGAFQSVQRNISGIEKATTGMRTKIENLQPAFQRMAVVGTAALTAIGYGANTAITNASNLEESINAVNVVFGEGARGILAFGETAAKSVGMSNAAFNQMATITGALLKDTGLGMNEVANQTNELTMRAADMASVFNTDVNDAMSAINQAIRGETEAIRRYAGDVTDASLQTYLFSQGIKTNVTDLTEQEKRLYRVDLIMAQTAVTAGDFANTSDSLANKQRILAAEAENLSVKLGNLLIPIKEMLFNYLGPLITKMGVWIEQNPTLAKNIVITTGVVAGLTIAVGTLGIALGILMSPIGLIVAALAGLAAGVYFVVTAFKNLANMVGLTTAKAKHAVVDLSGAFAGFVDPLEWQSQRVTEFSGAVADVGTAATDTADKIAQLKEEAAGIFGTIDDDEASSKKQLAEAIVAQEEKVSDIRSELRKLQRAEDTDANASRIRELRHTLEQERDALKTTSNIKAQLRDEVEEAERRASLSAFERQIEDIERARVTRLQAQVQRLQEIQTEIEAEQMKSNAIAGSFGSAQSTMQAAIKKTREVAETEAEKMKNAFDRAVRSMAQLNIGGSSRTSMSVTSKLKYTKVNDAVISPKGDVISTHPDDYLIATKNPAALAQGVGNSGGGITINIAGTFLDDRAAARRMGDQIMQILMQNKRL